LRNTLTEALDAGYSLKHFAVDQGLAYLIFESVKA
jgi:hypothetical protein